MEKSKIGIQGLIFEWIEEIAFASIVVIFILSLAFKNVTVFGPSMEPNYIEEDKLLVSAVHGEAEFGDVVVLLGVLETPIIKRVVATEGQTVDIDEETGTVYVDGVALDEAQFGLENGITTKGYTSLELTPLPQVVPEGHVFVLGDNRAVSEDSRYAEVGMVDERKIIGKAVFRFFPLSEFGTVE